jgi:hypothetical protein
MAWQNNTPPTIIQRSFNAGIVYLPSREKSAFNDATVARESATATKIPGTSRTLSIFAC